MTIHEYGKSNAKTVVLVHPSVVMWDFFEYLIPLLEKDCHVIIPALPGYDENDSQQNFTSVENIAGELAEWLVKNKITTIDVLYGCSMGGSIVLRMLADKKITVNNTICDGGITPYQMPWLLTRFIAVKDFLLISMGKTGGFSLLEKVFATDEYSKEDLEYMGKLEYWYGDKERKERAKDLAYVKEHFLHVKFIEMKNMGHASMATLYPENMAERIMNLAK